MPRVTSAVENLIDESGPITPETVKDALGVIDRESIEQAISECASQEELVLEQNEQFDNEDLQSVQALAKRFLRIQKLSDLLFALLPRRQ